MKQSQGLLRLRTRRPKFQSITSLSFSSVPIASAQILSTTKPAQSRTMSTTNQAQSNLSLTASYPMQSGYSIPVLGYGVYQTPANICESVTLHAFEVGYRHVDSARVYRNEEPCANAIRNSRLGREKVFFTSKVGPKEMGYEKARNAIDNSLTKTKLDYIDLFLLHAPYGGKDARCGAWKALVEAQKAGKVRSIGVSNYGVHHLDELEEYAQASGVGGKIDVGQWEIHPWLPRNDIVEWARQRGVVVQAWSPLVRSERSHEAVLKSIGDKHGKSWAQVLIRWSLQKGYVPLPKSVTPNRIEENANVYDFELDADDMQRLDFPHSYEPCSWDPTKEP